MTLEDFIIKENKLAETTQDVERKAMHTMLASLLEELKGFRNMYFSALDFEHLDSVEWDGHIAKARE